MTKEEQFVKEYQSKHDLIESIELEQSILENEYIESNRIYKDGQRVLATLKSEQIELVVKSAYVNFVNGKIEYKFYSVKKNGEPSKFEFYKAWRYTISELPT